MRYEVSFNGIPAQISDIRVSAALINRVWDGEQRPESQSAGACFASFHGDYPVSVEIKLADPAPAFEIRPGIPGLAISRDGDTVSVVSQGPCQFVLIPEGDPGALHVFLDPALKEPEGDVISFGKGEHYAGLIRLGSGQTLWLDEGAAVHGVVYAENAEDIRIAGYGTLDASPYRRGNDPHPGGGEIIDALRDTGLSENDLKYYGNLVLRGCRGVTVEGVVFTDAPMWSVTLRNGCENAVFDSVKIVGQWRYNTDGIDICSSKNVTVKNSFVRSFDDCLVVRNAYLDGEYLDSENVRFSNCVLWCDWGKSVEIWCSQKPGAIKNVTVEDCHLIRIAAVALNVTTWYGSASSLIENLVFKNVRIYGEKSYPEPVVEKPGVRTPAPRVGFIPYSVRITAEKLGTMKGLGTQLCEAVDDYSGFRIRYRGILFENVRTDDGRLRTDVCSVSEDVLRIEDLKIVNSDPVLRPRVAPPSPRPARIRDGGK
ncbi:MAG: right-handed parallel beta-helix repeat-containing protein [Clostridia bacterium]|nr:right-handed parallel beta-helix repeat-containing protein [Clostridia bacterium]